VSVPSAAEAATPSLLDVRDAPGFVARVTAVGPGYVPEWLPEQVGAEAAVTQIVARYLQSIARRLELAPTKNQLAFLDLVGVRLVPAQPARAPLAVELADDAADVAMPVGTRFAALPPPGGGTQVTFETERPIRLAVAKLVEGVSLWPGRDQFIDHSPALAAQLPFQLFESRALEDTPHVLYIAHERLLALAGRSAVSVTFELTTGGSDSLDVRWEYWDGAVWRPFKDMRPACSNDDPAQLDSTGGLTTSGAYRLEADCAETAKTTVDGFESFWVRGRLAETLPADPARVLPEVEAIRLSTEIARSYASIWRVAVQTAPGPIPGGSSLSAGLVRLRVRVLDATGVPLEGLGVRAGTGSAETTNDDGEAVLTVTADDDNTIAVTVRDFVQEETVRPPADTPLEVVFTVDMPALENAFSDGIPIDLTRPFFPFGLQPQPGSVFYFSHEEAFSKPGASLRMYVQPSTTPEGELSVGKPRPTAHLVSWEYWNGRAWISLRTAGDTAEPADFRARGTIDLTVPFDMAPTTVNDQEALWMRVRLVSGGYGFTQSIQVDKFSLEFFVPQPPSLGDLRLGYAWQDGPFPPERVVAFNDFRYTDRTFEAAWPGKTFQPFVPVSDDTPGLYLGFDRPLPHDDLGIYFGVVEARGETEGPALVWEYWNGFTWERLPVEDETRNLRVPGIVSLIGPDDMRPLARFDASRYWVRARLNEDGPPGEPTVGRVAPNAVWVVQQQTITDEPIGATTGQAGETLTFRQIPVLPGQEVEVRELEGARANVEWRIVASELFETPSEAIQELESALAAEGADTDVRLGPLRLRRDRLKRVVEAWVLWEERPTLLLSGPSDRHYELDRARGRLRFGDGERGRVPPVGALVAARRYRTGGGRAGNVETGSISQALGPIGGLERVANVAPAEGGADAETPEAVARRGPRSVRARGRAVVADDFATMAREASPSVAVARALPARDPTGRPTAGWVTLVIIPSSAEPRPFPSFGLRQQVRRYIEERTAADVAAAAQLVVAGPEYQAVDVFATLRLVGGAGAGTVERAVHDAVATFLHPLRGGPSGQGWSPGEDVFLSDLAAVVERVEGVDYSGELALLRDGVAQGERLEIGAGRIPVAGDIRLRLVEG
jgi:uncharacterized phage protein gp47/JayE